MLEIFLIIYISSKRIYPLAKEQGKSAFGWIVLTIVVWLGVEVFAIVILHEVFTLADVLFGLNLSNNATLYFLSYIVAVICSASSANFISRHLERSQQVVTVPPPPPDFRNEVFESDKLEH